MYGLIIENMNNACFADMNQAFDVLKEEAQKYNWLLSGYDYSYPSENMHMGEPYLWLNGSKVAGIWEAGTPHYFCVVTAYKKDITIDEVLLFQLPYADGYGGFWRPNITMQNPLAEIEIVRWDATYLLVISRSKVVIDKFVKEYPASTDLTEFNRSTM